MRTSDDRRMLTALDESIRQTYGESLVSSAIFGSVARETATPESDIDILIIAKELPKGRMARTAQFEQVEALVERRAARHGLVLSPVIKTPEEAGAGSPLFWDMTEDVIILYDKEDFFQGILDTTRETLRTNGARKVRKGSAWYWILKDDFTPGEVFET